MHVLYLQCVKCNDRYPPDKPVYRCRCGESLEIIYNYDEIKGIISWKKLRERPFRHWRYREFFPIAGKEEILSLLEGGTPLVRSRNLCRGLSLENIYFKCEGDNPTWSFKDRGTTVEISKAVEYGTRAVVCASTGNMGASVSAYAARGSIKAHIILPADTPETKVLQIKSYGAKIHRIDGDYSAAVDEANRLHKKMDWYLMGDYPYRGEGEKSIGFEIADEIEADYIISPIGNGTMIHGIWKGLKEFKRVGLIKRLPRLIGIQAAGCNTVVRALNQGMETIQPVKPETIATAIACGNPLDGLEALNALKESMGMAETVSDLEIMGARALLAEREGIFAEPAGAVALAGLIKLRRRLGKKAKVVVIVSGGGLKEPYPAPLLP